MGLRLATEKDCIFFDFWSGQQVIQGINCQGELFVVVEEFPLSQQSSAYDRADKINETAHSSLVVKTRNAYLVCAPCQGEEWRAWMVKAPPTGGAN